MLLLLLLELLWCRGQQQVNSQDHVLNLAAVWTASVGLISGWPGR
jgi:hypothetical protein